MTAGLFPDDVTAPAQYGPGMRSIAAYLCGYQHVPYDRARQVFADLLGVSVSLGWVANAVARIADTVTPIGELIADAVAAADVGCFDETGARVEGDLWWVHSASTAWLAHFDLHNRRGTAAMDDIGILPAFTGVAVHDGWAAYRSYTDAVHALCGAHHLRELAGVSELFEQPWAEVMIMLLLDIKTTVDSAKQRGDTQLSQSQRERYREMYAKIIRAGQLANPPPAPTGKQGRPKRSKPGNLVHRLDRYVDDVLRFMDDFRVPFDNNLAERDLRMLKVQQKISGGFRTVEGAMRHLDLRTYITTARKQGESVIDVLRLAASGTPWQPRYLT